ncbi:MAG TPA: DUF1028 domain-containing protein [Ignavibacteriaceae bacterium]|nr:DUF1028 domain-containing protein [Ignavibacteriaceae bacterium]
MKKILLLTIVSLFLIDEIPAQVFNKENPLTHTYSIVARDPETGEMGVAVQSHWFSVGSIVAWGEAGVGVVATQSFVNPSFGPRGLELMKNGMNAEESLDLLIASDEGREFRQLAILDASGNVKAFTGNKCIEGAGHIVGENYSVQANLMLNDLVPKVMAEAFEKSNGPLAERMIAAMEAAQNAGGDIRGQQSAAILVVRGSSTGNLWEDRLIDLRVEDHPQPIDEIKRLLKVYRAYEHMNNGDVAVENNDMELAMKEYSTAMSMFPDNLEMKYWTAITLVNVGELEKALTMFKEIFSKDKNWKILTPRLIKNEMLIADEETLKKIMNVIR